MSTERWAEIQQFFADDEWPIQEVGEGKKWLRTGFKGDHGRWTCYASFIEELDVFLFYSVCPITTPEDRYYAMAEFITRANYGMYIGNFEMDFGDGEIRYKSSIDLEGVNLSFELFKNIVYPNVTTMDRYLLGIGAVATSNTTPEDAIASIEDDKE